MTNITTVGVPENLLRRAKELKINISEISRIALKKEIDRREGEGK
jgi:post-segregation antitoxin (ccd killing protein)